MEIILTLDIILHPIALVPIGHPRDRNNVVNFAFITHFWKDMRNTTLPKAQYIGLNASDLSVASAACVRPEWQSSYICVAARKLVYLYRLYVGIVKLRPPVARKSLLI